MHSQRRNYYERKLEAAQAELAKAIKNLALVKVGEDAWPGAKLAITRIRRRIASYKQKLKQQPCQ